MLLTLKNQVEENTGHTFNSLLCNLYRSEKDSVDWHSDDEPSLGRCPIIASLSFGATRVFEMRRKPPPVSGLFVYVMFLLPCNNLWEKNWAPKRLLLSDLGDWSVCLVDEMFSTDGLYPVDNF